MASRVRVRSAGTVTVTERAVPWTSRAGSSGRAPSTGSGVDNRSVQSGSSSSGAWRSPAQRRNEVPGGESSPPLSASARSVSRMRQDTPSTTRWCRTRSSRPGCAGPSSNHTARTITPSSGDSARRAAFLCRATSASRAAMSRGAARSCPSASSSRTWVRQSSARTAPTGRMYRPRIRRASWRSRTRWRAAVSRSYVSPGPVASSRDWAKPAVEPVRSARRRAIGVPGSSPAGSSSTGGAAGAVVVTAASRATVGWSKTSWGVRWRPWRRARLTSWMAWMLSAPRANRSSSTPSSGRPSRAAARVCRVRSAAVEGARPPTGRAGAGSARRSTLPFGVTGIDGRTNTVTGTMWAGSRRARYARGSLSGVPVA